MKQKRDKYTVACTLCETRARQVKYVPIISDVFQPIFAEIGDVPTTNPCPNLDPTPIFSLL